MSKTKQGPRKSPGVVRGGGIYPLATVPYLVARISLYLHKPMRHFVASCPRRKSGHFMDLVAPPGEASVDNCSDVGAAVIASVITTAEGLNIPHIETKSTLTCSIRGQDGEHMKPRLMPAFIVAKKSVPRDMRPVIRDKQGPSSCSFSLSHFLSRFLRPA